ncbi:DUF1161 domain-containing protein [Pseudomonas sp. RIT-PI-S]|uniref:DUF1161 domain-containing protein n=1 Tax=Pseudomonas sp. RIT-PI-S TaxID=3035295 RepID=UPI0021DB583E|nr:DUF1161 domain-containing protein [Pseudomonas sp. RIT-PI-S]
MKKVLLATLMFSFAGGAFAAGKSCDDLKSEIDAKIQAKGASGYSLEVVNKGGTANGKVVGTCEGGTKEIVYKR